MDKGDKKKDFVEYNNGVGGVRRTGKSKFIWLKVWIVVLILLAIATYFLFLISPWESGEIDGTSEESSDGYFGKMEECLEMESFNLDCNLLFSSPGLYVECENLEDLRDKCFYEIAVRNFRGDLCGEIESNDLKNKCESRAFLEGSD